MSTQQREPIGNKQNFVRKYDPTLINKKPLTYYRFSYLGTEIFHAITMVTTQVVKFTKI